MNENDIVDSLKPLEEMTLPDVRYRSNIYKDRLQYDHSELSEIILKAAVPIKVRQLFETAKNVSLYSWYVYRFHPVAEATGFAALEMALRLRFYSENPAADPKSNPEKKDKTLGFLLRYAKNSAWISNKGFKKAVAIARARAEQNLIFNKIKLNEWDTQEIVPLDEPTEEQIQNELTALDFTDRIIDSTREARNDLAHGSNSLSPNSIWTLQLIAEIINQVYKK